MYRGTFPGGIVLPPSINSDPASRSGPFSPLSTTVRAFIFTVDNNSAFSSLVDSRRVVHIYWNLRRMTPGAIYVIIRRL